MGNNTSFRNPMFDDWKPSSSDTDIFINQKTGKNVRRHFVIMEQKEETIVRKRMN